LTAGLSMPGKLLNKFEIFKSLILLCAYYVVI